MCPLLSCVFLFGLYRLLHYWPSVASAGVSSGGDCTSEGMDGPLVAVLLRYCFWPQRVNRFTKQVALAEGSRSRTIAQIEHAVTPTPKLQIAVALVAVCLKDAAM